MLALPPELKSLSAIAARANEIEGIEPAVAYWARFWLVQKVVGQQQHTRSPEVEAYLVNVLEQLELTKEKFQGMAEIEDRDVGKQKVVKFALQVFNNADREERARQASRQTASKFLAAATFLEICQVFGESEKDVVDKRKYAKVQAMRIQSAIAAGKDPNAKKFADVKLSPDPAGSDATPAEQAELHSLMKELSANDTSGAPSDLPDENLALQSDDEIADLPLQNQISSVQKSHIDNPYFPEIADREVEAPVSTVDSDLFEEHAPASEELVVSKGNTTVQESIASLGKAAAGASAAVFPDVATSDKVAFKPDSDAMESCQKHAKWAISALNYEDVETAVAELKRALQALGQ